MTLRKPPAKVVGKQPPYAAAYADVLPASHRDAFRDAAITYLDECFSAIADGEPGQSYADTPLGTYLPQRYEHYYDGPVCARLGAPKPTSIHAMYSSTVTTTVRTSRPAPISTHLGERRRSATVPSAIASVGAMFALRASGQCAKRSRHHCPSGRLKLPSETAKRNCEVHSLVALG